MLKTGRSNLKVRLFFVVLIQQQQLGLWVFHTLEKEVKKILVILLFLQLFYYRKYPAAFRTSIKYLTNIEVIGLAGTLLQILCQTSLINPLKAFVLIVI